jgi:hypothetical protein
MHYIIKLYGICAGNTQRREEVRGIGGIALLILNLDSR